MVLSRWELRYQRIVWSGIGSNGLVEGSLGEEGSVKALSKACLVMNSKGTVEGSFGQER